MGDAVVLTNNVLSICSCRNEDAFFWNFWVEPGDCLKHNGCHLNFAISDKMNLKTTNVWITNSITQYGKYLHIWKCQVTMTKKGKNILIWKYHVPLAVTYSSQIIDQLSFSKINSLLSATSILSRSPMAYNTTAFLDKLACTDYVDFGKRQDWNGRFSWSKNDSNYMDIKLKVFERRQKCRISTETKPFNGRSWFQSVYSTKKSISCCSRQLSQRTTFFASCSIHTVQKHGGAIEACSQGDWPCGSPKQKVLCDTAEIQGGQPRNFLCSSPSIRTEEGGRKISASFVCQL